MGSILNSLKRMMVGDSNIISNNEYSDVFTECLIEVKLTEYQFDLAAIYYYLGSTSYRSFFKYVYMHNLSKINAIFDDVENKAKNGCLIEYTTIRFIHNNRRYIDIPFTIFSEKKDLLEYKRNIELWHRENIKRLLLDDPELSTYADSMLEETIKLVINEIL